MKPKDKLAEVVIMAEYISAELFENEPNDLEWCKQHAEFNHQEACEFMVFVGGNTKDFLNNLGEKSNQGLSQTFISHLKHARDIGAKWAMFYT